MKRRTAVLGAVFLAGLLALVWLALAGERGRAATPAPHAPASESAEAGAVPELLMAEPPPSAARDSLALPSEFCKPDSLPEVPVDETLPDESSVLLHVRDAASGRELAPVTVIELERSLAPEVRHPGLAGERAEEHRSSPVRLASPAPGEVHTVFARGPGHAWGRIEIGPAQRERFLALEPGGDLRVRVLGAQRDPGMMLRVFDAERALAAELDLHADELALVDGLPTGAYDVSAQIGRVGDARGVADADVRVAARATTDVILVVEPLAPARWVPLSGTLVLPPEWGLDDFQLVFQLQGPALERWPGRVLVDRVEMTLEDRATGRYRWDAREVQPGVYGAELPQLGFALTTVVGVEGGEARIVVGAPCAVHLRCVDRETGESLGPAPLTFDCGERGASAPLEVSGWNHARAAFEFRAPRGELRILGFDGKVEGVFQLGAGTNELEVRLAAAEPSRVRVGLSVEGAPLPWDLRTLPTLRDSEGEQTHTTWALEDGWLVLSVEHPGSYKLRVTTVEGYEPVPDQEIELRPGGRQTLAIELEPRR